MRDNIFNSHLNSSRFPPEPKGPGIGFYVWFGVIALLNLALWGVGVWAVIELVRWVTTK